MRMSIAARASARCSQGLFAAFALVVLAASPAAAAEGVHIRRIDASSFPEVEITASFDQKVRPDAIALTENGLPIQHIEVEPLSTTGVDVDVVLAIDTSGSMKGEPIASAVAAALKFTTSLPEDVSIGIVTFSDAARVLVNQTEDHSNALAALGDLQAHGETALYDGVALAARRFKGDAQHNLILLSDGADTASKASLDQAARAVKQAGASVFAVGLTSGEFDESALRRLSERGGGRYSPSGTADLSSVYRDFAAELSNQYVIGYESEYTHGGEVTFAVGTAGARDSALALVPKLQVPARPEQVRTQPAPDPLLEGQTGLMIVIGVCFVAIFLLLVMLLGSGARKKRDRELTRRTAAGPRPASSSESSSGSRWVPEPFVQVAETVGDIGGFTAKLERKIERAGASLRTGEFLLSIVGAAMVGALIGSLLLDSLVFSLLIGIVTATGPFIWLGLAVRRRSTALHDQLADILMILASSLRAGHSFFQALDMVAKEIGEPGATEFGRVIAEVRLGRPLDDAMNALADRIGSDDFKWALLAVNIQREVGGNLAEVLDTVADTIRDRDTIRRQIDVLTAEGRLSVGILTALPIGVAIYMAWVNPTYIGLLFETGLGLLMTTVASCLLAVGVVWMRKVVKIDV